MKVVPRCVPCILYDVYYTGKLATENVGTQLAILRKATEMLAEKLDPEITPSQLSSYTYRVVKQVTGVEDPYRKFKQLGILAAERVSHQIERELERARDDEARFRSCVLYSVASNVVDYSVLGHDFELSLNLRDQLNEILDRGLDVDNVPQILEKVREASSVLYVLDNSGEAVFDKFLIDEIKKYGSKVTAVAKGGPVSNDLTLFDALQIGMDKTADKVIDTGSDAYGIDFREASVELMRAIETSDLIMSKGQANYEDLSEIEGRVSGSMAYLMCAKCEPVARVFDTSVGRNIVKFVE